MAEVMQKITALSLCVACTACALPNPAHFARGDVEKKQFVRDEYECERDARNIRGGNCDQMDMYETCMKSKGYEPIPDTANKRGCR